MIEPISLEEAKNNLGIIKVFRYNKNFSILNLSKIEISSFFINENELKSESDEFLTDVYDKDFNSDSYLSLGDLISDLQSRIIDFFSQTIERDKFLLNTTSILSKMTEKYRSDKILLANLEESYKQFLSKDFKEFLDIQEDLNIDLGFKYIPLKSAVYYIKQSGLNLIFDKTEIKSIRLLKNGSKYSIEYKTKNDITFELTCYSSMLNRIRTDGSNSTIYFDENIAIKDYNLNIDEFNNRNLKFLL